MLKLKNKKLSIADEITLQQMTCRGILFRCLNRNIHGVAFTKIHNDIFLIIDSSIHLQIHDVINEHLRTIKR